MSIVGQYIQKYFEIKMLKIIFYHDGLISLLGFQDICIIDKHPSLQYNHLVRWWVSYEFYYAMTMLRY